MSLSGARVGYAGRDNPAGAKRRLGHKCARRQALRYAPSMDEDLKIHLSEIAALSEVDRLILLAWLAQEAPAVMREGLTWLDVHTPPQ